MTAPSLGEMCWPQVQAGTLLVPLGSTEQHGPHLPMDTDTRIAEALAARVAVGPDGSGSGDVLLAPALAYGASGEHQGFPGTISIGSDALREVVIELVRSATRTFSRVVLVCGHGGNLDGVRGALRTLRAERREVVAWFAAVPGGDPHAGRTETSLMLALAPDLVRPGPWPGGPRAPLPQLMPALRSAGVGAVSPTGILGDPAGASAAEGERLLRRLVGQLRPLTLGRPRASP